MNRKKSNMIFLSVLFLTGCSGMSAKMTTGQGEFKNKVRTDRSEIRLQQNIEDFHLSVKHEILKSDAIDDANLTLIDGDITSVGIGAHSGGLDLTAYISDDFYSFELMYRGHLLGDDFYPVLGVNHLDAFDFNRKTTAYIVGIGYSLTKKASCEATVTTRNNTAVYVDDYVQVGCGYTF